MTLSVREWMDKLVGDWQLSGSMGETEFRQRVSAEWVLDERFVEMRCVSEIPGPDNRHYEAIYFIGHNADDDILVMHLLDSLGVALTSPVGMGRLVNDAVEFVFDYASGPFINRFTYFAADDSWRHDLVSRQNGMDEPFATKALRRRPGDA